MARAGDKLWTLEEFLAFDDGTDTSYHCSRAGSLP
jgi:hypothetical protein